MPSLLRQFLEDCARYDPDFPSRSHGASLEDLRRVESIARVPIPLELRELWLALGASEVSAPFLSGFTWGVAATLEFYAERPVPPVQDGVHFGSFPESEVHFYIPIAGEDWKRPVLQFSWGLDEETGAWVEASRSQTVIAPSLLSYAYEKAFISLRVPRLPFWKDLHGPATFGESSDCRATESEPMQSRLAKVEQLALRLGFQPVPHAPGFYDRPDAAMLFSPEPYAHDSLTIFATDEREMVRLAETVAPALALRPVE